jgi:transposase
MKEIFPHQNDAGSVSLSQHYALLLGLRAPWRVAQVDLVLAERRLEIWLEADLRGAGLCCPDCGRACFVHDHAPARRWRHLDAMGFETRLQARVPRVTCPEHGVKTVAVPWAAPHGRFTLAFEAFVLEVLRASASVEATAQLLGLDWKTVQAIMERAVTRGLGRRELSEVNAVGFDEKSFRRGQSYISHLCDLRGARVLAVVEGRDQAAAQQLWQELPEAVRGRVEDAVMDMSAGFAAAARCEAPQARITFDKYHVASYLNRAVDQTRRAEHKELTARGEDILKGQRYLFLFNPASLRADQSQALERLLQANLKAGQAWAFKELFTEFWAQPDAEQGRAFLRQWCARVKRTRLMALKKVALLLERHWEGLRNYFVHRLTNALCEGFNSKIQQLKSAARGFRSFAHYRTRILFFLGKLDLSVPVPVSH